MEHDAEKLYKAAVEIVLREQKASASHLQRTLKIRYIEAEGLLERMEGEGIVSPMPELPADYYRRKVLALPPTWAGAEALSPSHHLEAVDEPDLESDEIPPKQAADVAVLTAIATFNGICHLIRLLAQRGILALEDVRKLHDAMTAPLDDPDMRDDELIVTTREALESVLSRALATIEEREIDDDEPD